MTHAGQEGTLAHSRLIGAFGFFLQLLLLVNQGGNISYHTIGTRLLAVLIIVWNAIDKGPLQFIAVVEERTHMGQGRLRLVKELVGMTQSFSKRIVDKV